VSQPEHRPGFEEVPWGAGVVLLERHPCGLLALSKPAGTLSHPNESKDQGRSLLQASYSLEQECYEWTNSSGKPGSLWLLNRLDSGTSGVILLAESQELALAIKAGFRRKHIRKVYTALVFGTPSVPVQAWRDLLSVDKKGGQVRTRAAGNIPCESRMRLLQKVRGQPLLSLIQLEPKTGRSHQLRVQCALRKLPIVGDQTYGDFGANRRFAKETGLKRLFLHSQETSFDFEYQGRTHPFRAQAPLPEEFKAAMHRD